MRKLIFIALSVTGLGLALTACAPRYYDDRYGSYDRPHADYGYRDRYDDRTYDRDRNYDRDRDYRDHY